MFLCLFVPFVCIFWLTNNFFSFTFLSHSIILVSLIFMFVLHVYLIYQCLKLIIIFKHIPNNCRILQYFISDYPLLTHTLLLFSVVYFHAVQPYLLFYAITARSCLLPPLSLLALFLSSCASDAVASGVHHSESVHGESIKRQ